MIDFDIWQHDREPPITIELADSSGVLTLVGGDTIKLRWRDTRTSIIREGTMTIVAPGPSPPPQVRYAWTADDVAEAGLFEYEVQVTFQASGKQQTFPSGKNRPCFRVNARLEDRPAES